jgi:hypothetical protein
MGKWDSMVERDNEAKMENRAETVSSFHPNFLK